jgi:hypothetical protein
MKFENTEVWGFEHAIRGMRNPMNSWNKSDSVTKEEFNYKTEKVIDKFYVGGNDLKLMQTLIRAGSEHRKFLRQIFVSVDITAPLYWWKEFDTYKIGTTANSTSTMHKLASTPITLECFETDDYDEIEFDGGEILTIINYLEALRNKYIKTKDKRCWKELIRWLPESWLQKRTITMNYENLLMMYRQRKSHKLNEWSGLDNSELPNYISWIKSLPYADELICIE